MLYLTMNFILASGSERRKELLAQVGIPFTLFTPSVEEKLPKKIKAKKVSRFLAELKLRASLEEISESVHLFGSEIDFLKESFVLSADTVIVHNNLVYGKAKNIKEAEKYLRDFSGDSHKVYTTLALYVPEKGLNTNSTPKQNIILKTVKTKVTFAQLTNEQIKNYLATDEWKDAAGAYKIQGKGSTLIKSIKGSYSNVVGLPLFELCDILRTEGVVTSKNSISF